MASSLGIPEAGSVGALTGLYLLLRSKRRFRFTGQSLDARNFDQRAPTELYRVQTAAVDKRVKESSSDIERRACLVDGSKNGSNRIHLMVFLLRRLTRTCEFVHS